MIHSWWIRPSDYIRDELRTQVSPVGISPGIFAKTIKKDSLWPLGLLRWQDVDLELPGAVPANNRECLMRTRWALREERDERVQETSLGA